MCRKVTIIFFFTKLRLAIVLAIFAAALVATVTGLTQRGVAAEPRVSGIRIGEHQSFTRVVIDLTGATGYEVRSLSNPYRIYVDFKGAEVRLAQPIQGDVGIVSGVRYGRLRNGNARVVIDTRAPARLLASQVYPPLGRLGHRLSLDLQRQSADAFVRTVNRVLAAGNGRSVANSLPNRDVGLLKPAAAPQLSADNAAAPLTRAAVRPRRAPERFPLAMPSTAAAATASVRSQSSAPSAPIRTTASIVPQGEMPQIAGIGPPTLPESSVEPPITKPRLPVATGNRRPGNRRPGNRRMVVIDPGHGGIDPGAIGKGGLREKDFTLAMSRQLRDSLLTSGRYDVRMTRDTDTFVRLRDRVSKAREFAAGRQSDEVLFISVHADSIRKSRVRGMSVYTLSEKASDAEAEELARRENRADLVAGHDLSGVDSPDVANILVEMALEESKRVAQTFASVLVKELSAAKVRLLRRPQRAAGFAVLKAPDIPSVLVELGYLSNRNDEKLLRNATHRRKLADALMGAIDHHFDGLRLAMAR